MTNDPLVSQFFAEIRGAFWGIFEQPDIVEIQTGEGGVIFQKPLSGKARDSGVKITEAQAQTFVRLCAHLCDSVINGSEQMLNGVVSVGKEKYRVSCTIPPVTKTTTFTIRRFLRRDVTLAVLVKDEVISDAQAEMLRRIVDERKTVIVAGLTGSGKTTLLNALLREANAATGRFVVIEENAREIDIGADANASYFQNTNETNIHDLMKNALRQSPERIIFGEIRDASVAHAFFQALTTGHPGSMTTLHAGDAQSAYRRISGLLRETGNGENAIADYLNAIVHIKENKDSKSGRNVSEICLLSRDKKGNILFNNWENHNHAHSEPPNPR